MPAVHIAGELFVDGTLDAPTCDRITADLFTLMEHTRQQLPRQPRLHKKIFATHLPGFAHSVGFTAICHWLDRDGWDITRPLPVPPLDALANQILAAQPNLLAISCSLPKHILHARRLITALRTNNFLAPIWIGGLPLNANPTLFPRSGADHTAPDILSFTRTLAKEQNYPTATPANLT
jgi:methanogenic corrinoid protein MtbC1